MNKRKNKQTNKQNSKCLTQKSHFNDRKVIYVIIIVSCILSKYDENNDIGSYFNYVFQLVEALILWRRHYIQKLKGIHVSRG
jgi:hypothetical protein